MNSEKLSTAARDLMWPLVVNSDLKMMTLSSGLATLRGQFSPISRC